MTKITKAILFVLPTVFLALIILFVPEIADSTSVFYVALIGTFLGFDILTMIKRTERLPCGSFEKLKAWRYILACASIAVLLCISFLKYKSDGSMKITMGSLSASFFIICGIILAGLDGNKIATESTIEETAPEQADT